MTRLLIVALTFLFLGHDQVQACGGGSGSSFSSQRSRGFVPIASPSFSPSSIQKEFYLARQASAARVAQYNARMQPIRMARAAEVRADKLARRQARTEIRLAKLEKQKQLEQEFMAQSRVWTDISGRHQVRAILVDSNDEAVRIRKQDGAFVNVPIGKLSSPDRIYVASMSSDDIGIMLARM